MKIQPAKINGFIKSPDPTVNVILVYGPEPGLVRERITALFNHFVDDPKDPFRVSDLLGDTLSSDPARLIDEATALSLTGGRRVVRIRGAGDALTKSASTLLGTNIGDTIVLMEAGDLPARSSLRKLIEAGKTAAAIPCYVEGEAELSRFIGTCLQDAGLRVDPDALAYLASNLVGDRLLARREIEKLIIYMGKSSTAVTLSDAMACVTDSAAISLDDLSLSIAGGNAAGSLRVIDRLLTEGVATIMILRALQRHFLRLHLAKSRIERGEGPDAVLGSLSPPVFFKIRPAFKAQLDRWPSQSLSWALDRIGDAEAACKRTGASEGPICGYLAMTLAARARAHGRSR